MNDGTCYDITRYLFDIKSQHSVFISPQIYAELYNKIAEKKEASSSQKLYWLIYQLSRTATSVMPAEKIDFIKNDPGDNKILECAVAAHADLIISMDKKHLLKLKQFRGIGIVHPQDFLYMLSK